MFASSRLYCALLHRLHRKNNVYSENITNNDFIYLIQNDWWYGSTNTKNKGWFPKAYVKETIASNKDTAPYTADNLNEYYIALYRYASAETGDLNFNQGEVILVTKKEGDWWTGCIGDKTGIFPSNYVEKCDVPHQV